jgi:hypothetical protein
MTFSTVVVGMIVLGLCVSVICQDGNYWTMVHYDGPADVEA